MNDKSLNGGGADTKNRTWKSAQGYTLIEAIIAIAICGASLAMILGQYGMALKTEMVSKSLFEQSLVINSIGDEINLSLKDPESLELAATVAKVLLKYPNYQLSSITPTETTHLYAIQITHIGVHSGDKTYSFKVFWRPDDKITV